jgi:hypothetical protein
MPGIGIGGAVGTQPQIGVTPGQVIGGIVIIVGGYIITEIIAHEELAMPIQLVKPGDYGGDDDIPLEPIIELPFVPHCNCFLLSDGGYLGYLSVPLCYVSGGICFEDLYNDYWVIWW